MRDLLRLEALGYRFYLDGETVRYRLVGAPPPEADALLRRLDKAQARRILRDRARGYTVVEPQVLTVPWGSRLAYLRATRAALAAGALYQVEATYRRKTGSCVYRLQPPGVRLEAWLERSMA